MRNISLQQYVMCESDPTYVYLPVDCIHWSMNKNCSAYCSEKKKNVLERECRACIIRAPHKKPETPLNNSPMADLKNNLPQFNHYLVEEEKNEKSFLEKAKSYSKAETSQIFQGKVSEEVFEKRKALCMACPSRINKDPDNEPIGWCRSCGCSTTNKRASLSNKLWMPFLECPLKKFGKEQGEGFKANDAIDSVKGIMTSVKDLFSKENKNDI